MKKRKKEDMLLQITQSDMLEEIRYNRYEININGRGIILLLSEECNKLFYRNDIIDNRFITTIDLIFDKLDFVGEEYKIYAYIKNNIICFTTIIDGNILYNNFTLDNYIINTCFGVCVKSLIKHEYVDFDKYF